MSAAPVALVTGGSRGIGHAIAIELARIGHDCVISYASNESAAAETKQQIEALGRRAVTIKSDIASADDRKRLVADALSALGRIDLLVNNAGVAPSVRADLLEAGEESFDRLISTNLKGPYFLTQLVAREMIALKAKDGIATGRIAFITSVSAYSTSINRGDYCVSKAGLSMAAALWAHRLVEHQIPVIEIRPGIIATDMTAGVKEKYDALIVEGLLPQKRWGTGEDVARAVCAFARGDLDYSTGVAIDVSGGFQLRRL